MKKLISFIGILCLSLCFQNCAPNSYEPKSLQTDLSSFTEEESISSDKQSGSIYNSLWKSEYGVGEHNSGDNGGAIFSFEGCSTSELEQAKAACDAVYAKYRTACSVIETVSGQTLYVRHGFGPAVSKKITCGELASEEGPVSPPPTSGTPTEPLPPVDLPPVETPTEPLPPVDLPSIETSSDPGFGVWIPDVNAKPLVVVLDQGGTPNVTVIPGCLNYKVGSGATASRDDFSSCDKRNTFSVKINGQTKALRLGPDVVFSIRYKTGPGGVVPSRFNMKSSIGGNIGIKVRMSVSAIPGDMTGMYLSRCTSESGMTPSISFGGKFACAIDFSSNPFHYVNIHAVDSRCLNSVCKEIHFEPVFRK